MTKLSHPEAEVCIEDSSVAGRRNVRVDITDPTLFSPRKSCLTSYPDELIQLVLDIKGPAYLCDEIARDEDPGYVEDRLRRTLLGYVAEEDLAGKRILDFGCGSGASTMILSRMFPRAEIVGIELNEKLLSLARARALHYGFQNLRLLQSPSGTELPDDPGDFDFVMLNAVYEHLLPDERLTLMPRIWRLIRPGGLLFIDETPNRIYHVEGHTTGLPLINYLSDRLAHAVIRRFSYRLNDASWPILLREGVRGGSEGEILALLNTSRDGRPGVIEPTQSGMKDRIDLHFMLYRPDGILSPGKKLRKAALKIFRQVTGITYLRVLSIMIRKG